MIKIEVITGFLGAGKTTFIQKMLDNRLFENEKIVIIENEFGKIPIDNVLLSSDDYSLIELSSGCICCSLKGDLIEALIELASTVKPDRVIIEPSGVFTIEDLFPIVESEAIINDYMLEHIITLVDPKHFQLDKMRYAKFYESQLLYADAIIVTKSDLLDEETKKDTLRQLAKVNDSALVSITNMELWDLNFSRAIFNTSEGEFVKPVSFKLPEEKLKHDILHPISSIGLQGLKAFEEDEFIKLISILESGKYGHILRIKGFVVINKQMQLFNYVQGESDYKQYKHELFTKLTIIGENLKIYAIKQLFGKEVFAKRSFE